MSYIEQMPRYIHILICHDNGFDVVCYGSQARGGSRNVEGGVLMVCRPVGSNFVVARALLKVVHRGV